MGLQSKATIDGNDWSWGWNVGFAWDVTPQGRLAASYRSEIKYDAQGNIGFENPTLPSTIPPALAPTINALAAGVNSQALYGRSVSSDITLPQNVNLSVLFRPNPKWELMADAQWTGWSSIPELKFVSSSTPALPATPLNWDDTWKLSVGASYKVSDQWKARFGLAFDQTPVTVLMILDADMTVPPEDLPRFYALVGGRGEFINGVRSIYPMQDRSMRFIYMIGNKFFSLVFS